MGPPFCCVNIDPCRSRPLDHDNKFSTFITWAREMLEGSEPVIDDPIIPSLEGKPYAVQLVRQVNYGPLESKRYFVPRGGQGDQGYLEVTEGDLVNANFQKLNSWKG
ncbi:MAG: hypothetical protein FRX48_08129 [Lasallia pustulata]|uniref:Uncharacterized protein n=1 Tax=Lasallia pustulata TaxID=136370 RepID=A0A5M8PGA9_9LECA|nr:MAG: hypothetical protein FRX48_08129 [Lasallia pustulata]